MRPERVLFRKSDVNHLQCRSLALIAVGRKERNHYIFGTGSIETLRLAHKRMPHKQRMPHKRAIMATQAAK
jgi:hypothetical protein